MNLINFFSEADFKNLIKYSLIFDPGEISEEKVEKSIELLKSIVARKQFIQIFKLDSKHNSAVDIETAIFDSIIICKC